MLWLLVAVIEPLMHALANVFDNYFINNLFKKPGTLVFFSSLMNLVFLPLLFLFHLPTVPAWSEMPLLMLLGLISVAYVYPYYRALQSDDTSVVTSLFSIGSIFVPILSFFIIGEVLRVSQYIGFLLIITASSLLTLNLKTRVVSSKALFYMSIVSLILAVEAVTYKYVLTSIDWVTALTWSTMFSFLFAMPLYFFNKENIHAKAPAFRKSLKLFALEELATFVGVAAAVYATALAPVTLVRGVASLQPVFVLGYAVLFSKAFPKAFKEKIDGESLKKKILLFALIIIGSLLAFS